MVEKNRTYWVDYAKAIGISLVVFGHVAPGIQTAGIAGPREFLDLVQSVIYTFHMPLFFFLSGLFFYGSLSKRGPGRLLLSKVDTVAYPYLLWSIIQGLVEATLSKYTNGQVSYREVFSLLWMPRAQFWFLYALFFSFVVATAVFSLVSIRAAVVVFILAALAYLYPSVMPNAMVFGFIARNFVFFAFGVLFSRYFRIESLASGRAVAMLAVAFAAGQILFHANGLRSSDAGILLLLLALTSILFVVSFSAWASRKPSKVIVLIGTSSMAIYLMHVLAGSGTRVILQSVLGIESFPVHLIAGCLIAIAAPLLAEVVIERWGIRYVFSAPISKLLVRS
jgi:fucose 4-O-acetylase-like acetyltransferase